MSRGYACLPGSSVRAGPRRLEPLRREDIMQIREWRNAQIRVLRQESPLSVEHQERWFATVVEPQFAMERPPQLLFSYLLDDNCIGYGGLTNVAWAHRRAELSFLLDDARACLEDTYSDDFSVFLELVKHVAFGQAGLNRIFAETYDIRPLHVAVLERRGFVYEGRMREHVFIDGRPVDSLLHGCLAHA